MRIISGARRGTKLTAPPGNTTRPTPDRVREGLFNVLSVAKYAHAFASPVIADVFAGSGMLGLEAYSRGARQVVFIENNEAALAALGANIRRLDMDDAAVVLARDATRNLAWPAAPAGLVFLDPPWNTERNLAGDALENLLRIGAIAKGAIISVEHDYRHAPEFPPQLALIETRRWGRSACTILSNSINGG